MKKQIGYSAEQIVTDWYREQGRDLIDQNWTIRGGEIDIIVEQSTVRCFVEVKCSNYLTDFGSLLSRKKKSTLKRAVWTYMHQHPTHKQVRIDVVFVVKNNIVHLFDNVIL